MKNTTFSHWAKNRIDNFGKMQSGEYKKVTWIHADLAMQRLLRPEIKKMNLTRQSKEQWKGSVNKEREEKRD